MWTWDNIQNSAEKWAKRRNAAASHPWLPARLPVSCVPSRDGQSPHSHVRLLTGGSTRGTVLATSPRALTRMATVRRGQSSCRTSRHGTPEACRARTLVTSMEWLSINSDDGSDRLPKSRSCPLGFKGLLHLPQAQVCAHLAGALCSSLSAPGPAATAHRDSQWTWPLPAHSPHL